MVEDIQHLGHLGRSDHQCLKFQIRCTFMKHKPVTKTRYRYHQADFLKLQEKLDINWEEEMHGKSADEAYTIFLSIMLPVMSAYRKKP